MNPLSSLSLPSDNLDELLVKGIYDGIVEIEDGEGKIQSYFVKRFGQHDVLFDSDGIAYLSQAAIAALLGLARNSVNESISYLAQSGFITDEYRYVRLNRQKLSDGKRYREIFVFSAYVINLIAARMRNPTPQALAFLRFREDIFEAHQKMIHHNRLKLLSQLGETLEKLDSVTWAALEGETQVRRLQAYVDDLTKERDEAINQNVLSDLEARYGAADEWE